MSDTLSDLLAERRWLLADGATGTNLFAAGLGAGEPPELWNIDEPDKIRALHQGFIDAGADLILTNSFGGNAMRLKLHGAQDRVLELNARAAELARERADAAGRPVIVAGSMGPTGELLEPVGALSFDDAVAAFQAQGEGLLEGGADLLWAETISSREEIAAAAAAAANLGAPFCGTLSFDTAGRTMMGLTAEETVSLAGEWPSHPIGVGANCGVGASDLLRTLLAMAHATQAQANPEAVLIAKSNAGVPKFVDGAVRYDGTPELMGRFAVLAARTGARIIGGCCGNTYEHVRQMRLALDSAASDPLIDTPPSLDEIVAATGPFTAAEAPGAGDARRERRGRRAARE